MMGSRATGLDMSEGSDLGVSTGTSGIFEGLERQGRIMESADKDSYDPPSDGELSRSQVEEFVAVMTKTRDYRTAQAKRLEELGKKVENDDVASMAEAMSGLAGVANITNAEMEVVKTGGGNWAEHLWVKEQIYVARIQKDINETVEHNYELYLEFEDKLNELGF